MATVNAVITRIRDSLDEPTAAAWTNTQLKRWINQAVTDIAVVAKPFETSVDVSVIAGTSEYTVAATIIQIDRCYYLPTGSSQAIPLSAKHWEKMDEMWGSWQNISSGDPYTFSTFGYSPNLKVKLYPVPSRAGTLRIYHRAAPAGIVEDETTDNSTLGIPDFWTEAIVYYVEMRARRKDGQTNWQEAMQLYNEKRQQIMEHDAMMSTREFVHDYAAGGVPRWLADYDYP